MKFSAFIISLLLICNSVYANNIGSNDMNSNCAPPTGDEPTVYNSDFHWGYDLNSLKERYDEIYKSGKRLLHRATYDSQSDKVYLHHSGIQQVKPVLASWNFVNSVRRHIENAIKMTYVDRVFFPDMGHSHMLVDREFFELEISNLPVSEMNKAYEMMINHPKTRFLYHTAEQLQTLDKDNQLLPDKQLQWRFYTRNLVGDNHSDRLWIYKDLNTKANTVNSPDDQNFHWWSAGFNISASINGCFPFNNGHEIQYFDISLSDLPSQPGAGDIYGKQKFMNVDPNMPIWKWEKLQRHQLEDR